MVLIKIKAEKNKLESRQIEAKPIKSQVLVLWLKKKDNGMFHRKFNLCFCYMFFSKGNVWKTCLSLGGG